MQRQLAAILAADMADYSRLVEANEEGTIARQMAHRSELIDPIYDGFTEGFDTPDLKDAKALLD